MSEMTLKIVVVCLAVMTLVGFLSMGIDKARARSRKKKRRISEKTLFLIAVLGGSLGSMLGMAIFRHKTKHWYFVVGMPLIAILETAAAVWLLT